MRGTKSWSLAKASTQFMFRRASHRGNAEMFN